MMRLNALQTNLHCNIDDVSKKIKTFSESSGSFCKQEISAIMIHSHTPNVLIGKGTVVD